MGPAARVSIFRCHPAWVSALLWALVAVPIANANDDDVLVFAAASLKPVLEDVLATPEARAAGDVTASYAASSQLARQIQHGAPAAIFISADQDWMDDLDGRGEIDRASRVDLIGNTLVLIAPADHAQPIDPLTVADLADALGADGRLAIAEPNSVPAGKYAKAALSALGLWEAIASRTVAAANVRAALAFVVRKEAALGIVYRSDALSEPSVRIVHTFAANTHPAIVYPMAVVTANDSPAARALLDVLRSDLTRSILVRHGFVATGPPSAQPEPAN